MTKFLGWLFTLKYFAVLAVIAPVFGSILMFFLGTRDTVEAYLIFFGREEAEGAVDAGEAAMIKLVASVDHFLFGTILMVFALGLYFLFFRSGRQNAVGKQSEIPSWSHMSKLEGMDLMLMKVIIMLLTVSFLEFILSAGMAALTWPALVIPITIIALALALRWMQSGSGDDDSGAADSKPEAPKTSPPVGWSYLDELERLASLHSKGALTDDEYRVRKEKILEKLYLARAVMLPMVVVSNLNSGINLFQSATHRATKSLTTFSAAAPGLLSPPAAIQSTRLRSKVNPPKLAV